MERVLQRIQSQSYVVTVGAIRRSLLSIAAMVADNPDADQGLRKFKLRTTYLMMSETHRKAFTIPDIRVIGFIKWLLPGAHDSALDVHTTRQLQRRALSDCKLLEFPKDFFVFSFVLTELSYGRGRDQSKEDFIHETSIAYSLLDKRSESIIAGIPQLNGAQLCRVISWVAAVSKRKELIAGTAQVVPLHLMDIVADCLYALDDVSVYSSLTVNDVYTVVQSIAQLRLTPENLLDNLSVHTCSAILPELVSDKRSFYELSILIWAFSSASDLGRMPFKDVLGQLALKIQEIGIDELKHCTGPQLARIAMISSLVSCKWGYSERGLVPEEHQVLVSDILSKIGYLSLNDHYHHFLRNSRLQWRLFTALASGGDTTVIKWISSLLSQGNLITLEHHVSIVLNILQALIRYREGIGYRDVIKSVNSSTPKFPNPETEPLNATPVPVPDTIPKRKIAPLPAVTTSALNLESRKGEEDPTIEFPRSLQAAAELEAETEIPESEATSEHIDDYEEPTSEGKIEDMTAPEEPESEEATSTEVNKYEDLFDVLDTLHSTVQLININTMNMRDVSGMIQVMSRTGTFDRTTGLLCLQRAIDILQQPTSEVIPPYQLVYLTHGLTDMVVGDNCPSRDKIPPDAVFELFASITAKLNKGVNLSQFYPTALSAVLWAATRVKFFDEDFIRYACNSLNHPEALHRSCTTMLIKAVTALSRVSQPVAPDDAVSESSTQDGASDILPRNTGSHLRNLDTETGDRSVRVVKKWKHSTSKVSEGNIVFKTTEQLTYQIAHLLVSQNLNHSKLPTILDLTLLALSKRSCSWNREDMIPAAAKLSDTCFNIWNKNNPDLTGIGITGKQLARILWSHAAIQLRNHSLCDFLMKGLRDRETVTNLMSDPMSVTTALVAASQLRLKDMISLGNLCSHSAAVVSEMTPLSLADTIQAVVELGVSSRQLQLIAAGHAAVDSSNFTPQQAVTFIWHFARSKLLPQLISNPTEKRTVSVCYLMLIKRSMQGVDNLEPRYLCRLLHTIGFLDGAYETNDWVAVLCDKIVPQLGDIWWRDLANVLWSLGHLRYLPPAEHLQKLIYARQKSNFLPEDIPRVKVWDDFLETLQ